MKNWFNNLTIIQRKIVATIIIAIGFVFFFWGFIDQYIILPILGFIIGAIGFIILVKVEKIEKEEKEKQEEIKRLEEKKKLELLIKENEKKAEEKKKELELIKEEYKIPEGKTLSYTRTITTKIRGVYYQDIYEYDINLDDEVYIKHTPTEQHPESTEIRLLSNGSLLGYLKEEIANEFVIKYGDGYCFIGSIVEYETADDEEDEDDEDKINKILICFNVPSFKKL